VKVLFITEFFPSTVNIDVHGGVEARAYQIAMRMQNSAVVIASREVGKPEQQFLFGMSIFRVGLQRRYARTGEYFGRASFIISAIIKGLLIKCDVIEASSFFAWLPAFVLAYLKGCKCILVVADTVDAYAADTNVIAYLLLNWYERLCLGFKWDSIIAISDTTKIKLQQKNILGSRVNVIYCGVSLKEIGSLKVSKCEIPTVCCIARLVPYKRVQDLIEAVALLNRNRVTVRLDIIGSGEEETVLKELVLLKKLDSRIEFHSYLPKQVMVWRLLKKSHLFCLPSLVEGFGLVTIEAMAAEIPVILPDLPIHHEITRDKGVVFYRGRDCHDLAAKIETLLRNRKLYTRLKKQTRGVVKRYQWSNIFEQTNKLYECMLAN